MTPPKPVATQLDRIEHKVDQLNELLEGDGSESNPGLKIRVDRLVQDSHRRTWLAKTALGASVTALIGMIVKSLHG